LDQSPIYSHNTFLVQNVETTRSLTDTSEGKYLVKTKSALQSSVWLTSERPFNVAQDRPRVQSQKVLIQEILRTL
jgi:hypothetical protein